MTPVVFTDASFGQNCYLIRAKNEVAVIDPGFNGEAILAYLAEKGYHLAMVLLTHAHYDHIRDLRLLQKTLEFPLYVHPLDVPFLTDDALNGSTYFHGSFRLRAGQPMIPVTDGMTIPFGTTAIKVIHTPGHTPGGVCYLYENELFAGDTLFQGDLGRTDLAGGSARQLTDSIKKLFKGLSDGVVVQPGHESKTTIGEERKTNHQVQAILKRI
ncbi:MAG TPA: hypothetical protein DCR44_00140 [Acholeplasmatales bacterium]|nr:MAG: hypothetical protein A2Y16_01565 [Tenericutes bacterium GWF2_57_13]HAQ55813.1 hypothetical protein [Acholeplasmatales bacterium]